MWALFERRKFERFLCEFRAKTQKIKELVPLILALHPQYNNSLILEKLIANEHSNRVGMAPHARLRRLTINPATDTTDFLLNDVSLCALLESESVSVANLTDKTLTASGAQLEPERVLVEFKKYGEEADTVEEAAPDLVTKNRVHQLACLLSSAGRDGLHTLSLRGLIYQPAQSRYAFLFDFPVVAQECDPISLWTLIESTSSKSRLTLPQRFQVARYVATALSAFHVDGWVHKSIRSQSIVFFHNANDPSATLSADCYLVDFEFARPENAETQHTFDNHLEKNLYRHPDRQGTPTISFQKHHDIYSLGVVLLEIGLWMTASHIYQNATARMKTGVLMNPRGIRNLYIDIANRKLPHNMGPAYRGAVVKCLSGGFQETDTDLTMEFYEEVVQSIDVFKLA
jgi:serine/threonine protein kinase